MQVFQPDRAKAQYLPIFPGPGANGKKETCLELVLVGRPEQEKKIKLKADESRAAEAQWIARWIASAGSDGDAGTARGRAGKRPYRDVAIIMRSMTPLSWYLEELKAAEIPYVVEGEKYFYATQEVSDFLNLLSAIDDPTDSQCARRIQFGPLQPV